jgi:LacI family transcriptional regulator
MPYAMTSAVLSKRQKSEPPQTGAAARRPTMTDVARLAEVSQSSVSLVLNNMSGARIAPATRERVLAVARDIGYALPGVRRASAQPVEHNTIAYLVDEISTSPHPVITLDGARDFAWEAGYLVKTYVTRSNPDLERATLEAIARDPSVVGILYSTIFTRKISLPEGIVNLPVVLLNCYCEHNDKPAIVPAEVSGGFAACMHLIDKGHRRIALINGEPWMDASIDRLKGYRQALASADLPYDASLVSHGDWLPGSGREQTLALMRRADPPSAIFCANDLMALGALEAAMQLGLNVPADLSVMGYDDQELSRYTNPPLSTIVLPNYELGRSACETLLDIAAKPNSRKRHRIKIDGPLVERQSVGPPRAIRLSQES